MSSTGVKGFPFRELEIHCLNPLESGYNMLVSFQGMKRECSKMSLIPAFEIGLWNAWIITVFLVLIGMVPGLFISKEEVPSKGVEIVSGSEYSFCQ
jgi:hypothetical protein